MVIVHSYVQLPEGMFVSLNHAESTFLLGETPHSSQIALSRPSVTGHHDTTLAMRSRSGDGPGTGHGPAGEWILDRK